MAQLHALVGHNLVTVDIYQSYEKAFSELQALGKRIGFKNVKIHSYQDTRTPSQISPNSIKEEEKKGKRK